MKLYLDDVRPAPEGWVWAVNLRHAQALIAQAGNDEIEEMSLDHDLGTHYCRMCLFSDTDEPCLDAQGRSTCGCTCHGEEPNGLDFLKWIHETGRWPTRKPLVHSANPVGAKRMRDFIDDFGPYASK